MSGLIGSHPDAVAFFWYMPKRRPNQALNYDERRARVKVYRKWIEHWQLEQRTIDSKFLDPDIADLESWIGQLNGVSEVDRGRQRIMRRAGKTNG